MKSLTNLKATITGGKLTLTADIIDKDYSSFPVEQKTIMHTSKANPHHHRHIQISQQAVFVKTPGKQCGFAVDKDLLVDLATQIEPRLNYVPLIQFDSSKPLTVNFPDELKPDLQWQKSADGKTWVDVAGQTSKTLTQGVVPSKQYIRLKASGEWGEMYTNAVIS